MNGIIFWENGDTQILGQLTTVRLIALKVQEIIPSLVQQERDAVISTMNRDELRMALDRIVTREQNKNISDE